MKQVKSFFLILILLFFPLLFLPTTQEFFSTNKLYFLLTGSLLLILVSTIELFMSKKLVWKKNLFDRPVLLFLITVGLSVLISSPNKIQALINPSFGFAGIAALSVLYLYLAREKKSGMPLMVLNSAVCILSLVAIIFFFQPFKSIELSPFIQFLKNPFFNLLGSPLDVAIVLAFFTLYNGYLLIRQDEVRKRPSATSFFFFVINALALVLTVFNIFKSALPQQVIVLPPFSLSWYAAVETLKTPVTALFGVGVDNFAAMFTRVKDLLYNQSPLWQIGSFTVSRSAMLHISTEAGLFGLIAFILLVVMGLKKALTLKKTSFDLYGLGFIVIIMLLFPISLPVLFLFFIMISQVASDTADGEKAFDLSEVIPLYLGLIIFVLIIVGGVGYFTGKMYLAEYYFKKSQDGIINNSLKELYDNERTAIILNPFIERYRINFSQTNLLIANNMARSIQATSAAQLSDRDRQTIAQAIQTGIAEAKTAVSLNQQKAGNWENLALIYRNILNVAQGADVWTISAYQRAIVLDPQNPIYRLSLGGVYYSLNQYDQSTSYFEQTTSLKPDWSNAHYNLAWSAFQKQDYQRAVSEMQTVISLLNPETDKVDYDKAQKELAEFKKKLPQAEETKPTGLTKPGQLSLPTPQPTLQPKIQLPKTASPEAK